MMHDKLEQQGILKFPSSIITASASVTIASLAPFFILNCTANGIATLPDPSTWTNRIILIKGPPGEPDTTVLHTHDGSALIIYKNAANLLTTMNISQDRCYWMHSDGTRWIVAMAYEVTVNGT